MNKLFDYDNGIMSAINKITDTVVLGIFWMLCSIPIFTVGASSAAFYYTYQRCVVQRLDHAWKTFFVSFKANFKQATQIWLIVLGIAVFTVVDCFLLSYMAKSMLVTVIQTIVITVMLSGTIWALYLFPYLSRFENTNKATMKNCALIVLANMPQSLLLFVLFVLSVFCFICFPLVNMFIPSLYMYFANKVLEKIFRKYMTPEELAAQLRLEQPQSGE